MPDRSPEKPGLIARAAASVLTFLEKKAAPAMRHPRSSGGTSGAYWGDGRSEGAFTIGALLGDDWDVVADAGDIWLNSVVSACIFWLIDQFPEPEMRVTSLVRSTGDYEPHETHELVDLLETPNSGYSTDALWAATVLSYQVSGNAYWIKARDKSGKVKELWHASPWEIQEVWPDDGSAFLSGYKHVVDGVSYDLAREDVVHFRRGLDPLNPRRGLSPLGAVLREVATDNHAAAYEAAVLRNMGIVPTYVQPAEVGDEITPANRRIIQEQFQAGTTGANRGRVVVSSARLDVKQFGLSPRDMALGAIRTIPEDRICAATGVNAQVLGLSAGDTHNTYENQAAATRGAYNRGLVPMQRSFARTLTRQLLLADFGGRRGVDYAEWCYDEVAALSEDANDRLNRGVLAFKERLVKRGEACEIAGCKPPDPEFDVYLEQPTVESARAWAAVDADPGTDPDAFGKPRSKPPGNLDKPKPAVGGADADVDDEGDGDGDEDENLPAGRMRIAKALTREARASLNGHPLPPGSLTVSLPELIEREDDADPFPARPSSKATATPPVTDEDQDGDEDTDEANTYNLPSGRPIRDALVVFFNDQLKETLGAVERIVPSLEDPTSPASSPPTLPPLTKYDNPMAEAMTPILTAYWDEAGGKLLTSIGLDPADWRVVDPNTKRMIEEAAFAFSHSTNETTTLHLGDAIAKFREEMTAGIVDHGDSVPELTKRVQGVFDTATKARARTIAQTEASRAVHAAQVESARQSGVVWGKSLLLSSDACSLCESIKASEPEHGWALEGEVYNDGKGHPDYSSVPYPPLHVNCLLGETPILAPGLVTGLMARYDGPIVRIVTDTGGNVAATPNHMLLTPLGFASMATLREGDEIIRYVGPQRMFAGSPHDDGEPTPIQDVVASLAKSARFTHVSVPVTPEYLHGDGAFVDSEIDVVTSESHLWPDRKAGGLQAIGQPNFIRADIGRASLLGEGALAKILLALGESVDSGLVSRRPAAPFLRRLHEVTDVAGGLLGTQLYAGCDEAIDDGRTADIQRPGQGVGRLAGRITSGQVLDTESRHHRRGTGLTECDTYGLQSLPDEFGANPERLSDLLRRFSGEIATCKVVRVEIEHYSGPVYDVQTRSSLYLIGDGIASSNCRCSVTMVLWEDAPPGVVPPEDVIIPEPEPPTP